MRQICEKVLGKQSVILRTRRQVVISLCLLWFTLQFSIWRSISTSHTMWEYKFLCLDLRLSPNFTLATPYKQTRSAWLLSYVHKPTENLHLFAWPIRASLTFSPHIRWPNIGAPWHLAFTYISSQKRNTTFRRLKSWPLSGLLLPFRLSGWVILPLKAAPFILLPHRVALSWKPCVISPPLLLTAIGQKGQTSSAEKEFPHSYCDTEHSFLPFIWRCP